MDGSRIVYYVSDSTGMTVEELGRSVLTQFEGIDFIEETLPFVDNEQKVQAVEARIRQVVEKNDKRPIVFCSFGTDSGAYSKRFSDSGALTLDCLEIFLRPLEKELGTPAVHMIGRRLLSGRSKSYQRRIDALNFTMNHDDGASLNHLDKADIILIGVSRSGKTPTSLHLALHYGVFAANYPLVDEDLNDDFLPLILKPYVKKLYGLSIAPKRLAQIRAERRPNSRYAELVKCQQEVGAASRIFRTNGIPYLDVTKRSVEELAAKILQEAKLARHL